MYADPNDWHLAQFNIFKKLTREKRDDMCQNLAMIDFKTGARLDLPQVREVTFML